jgi:hypothetical protein
MSTLTLQKNASRTLFLSPLARSTTSASNNAKLRTTIPMHREHVLQKQVIRYQRKHPPFTQLYAQEWEVIPGYSQFGKGDLVFKRPAFEEYLVIETKYIRTDSGKTARGKRTRNRKKVVEQALRYGAIFKQHNPGALVEIATFTNDVGLCSLGFYENSSIYFSHHDVQLIYNKKVNT